VTASSGVNDRDGGVVRERAVGPLLRREPVQVLLALATGVLLSVVLLGAGAGVALWRLAVLPVALLFVVRGIGGLIGLGRSEWRRERTGLRAYLVVVLRFVLAYLLVVAAVAA
jgi:hypothetical protein